LFSLFSSFFVVLPGLVVIAGLQAWLAGMLRRAVPAP